MEKKSALVAFVIIVTLICQQTLLALANSGVWGPLQRGLMTRLIPLEQEHVLGQPIRFRLEMINETNSSKNYDSQQVKVNNSMLIKDHNDKVIPYSAEQYMTTGSPRRIQPGETVILFDNFDITSQYQIDKPGEYTIQFRGQGQAFGDVPIPPSNVISIEIVE
ncbi:MAG: BsuPI-related putative proteinase inhibitor [Candidatus Omnitrophota bacterium]